MSATIGVIGAGAWGTALAQMLASDGREVLLWVREPELVDEINQALDERFATHTDPWEGYLDTCLHYYDLLHDPALRRILLQDAPAVLGPRLRELEEESYIGPMAAGLMELQHAGVLRDFDPVAMAHLINGAMGDSGMWVIAQDDPQKAAERVKTALRCLMEGLRRAEPTVSH